MGGKKNALLTEKEDKITADSVSEMSSQKLIKQENNGVTLWKCWKKLSTCISIPSKIFYKNEGILNKEILKYYFKYYLKYYLF